MPTVLPVPQPRGVTRRATNERRNACNKHVRTYKEELWRAACILWINTTPRVGQGAYLVKRDLFVLARPQDRERRWEQTTEEEERGEKTWRRVREEGRRSIAPWLQHFVEIPPSPPSSSYTFLNLRRPRL